MTSSPAVIAANRRRSVKHAAARIGCSVEEYQERIANGEAWCSGHRKWHDATAFSRGKKRDTRCRELKSIDRRNRKRVQREKAAAEQGLEPPRSWTESYVSFLVASSTVRACSDVDPEWFFPETPEGEVDLARAELAKSVCRRCPVADDCLTAACQRNERFGIFGAFTTDERDQIMGLKKPEWAVGL